jgi:hypothetical protein
METIVTYIESASIQDLVKIKSIIKQTLEIRRLKTEKDLVIEALENDRVMFLTEMDEDLIDKGYVYTDFYIKVLLTSDTRDKNSIYENVEAEGYHIDSTMLEGIEEYLPDVNQIYLEQDAEFLYGDWDEPVNIIDKGCIYAFYKPELMATCDYVYYPSTDKITRRMEASILSACFPWIWDEDLEV